MRRLHSVPVAVAALLVTAGVVGADSLPTAASNGLGIATEHSGRIVPVRPDAIPDTAPAAAPVEQQAPEADVHGAAVSAVAKGEDATPDTNHGADVSAVARDNHGQATAAQHKPADAGKPDTAGKPDGAGKPADAGRPADPGRP